MKSETFREWCWSSVQEITEAAFSTLGSSWIPVLLWQRWMCKSWPRLDLHGRWPLLKMIISWNVPLTSIRFLPTLSNFILLLLLVVIQSISCSWLLIRSKRTTERQNCCGVLLHFILFSNEMPHPRSSERKTYNGKETFLPLLLQTQWPHGPEWMLLEVSVLYQWLCSFWEQNSLRPRIPTEISSAFSFLLLN